MDLLGDDDFSINVHPIALRILSKISNFFKNVDLSNSLPEIDLSQYNETLRNEENEYGDMYHHVWGAFKTDAIQMELITGAINFVIKYRQLSKRIDWSDASIWNFKRDHIRELFKYSQRLHGNKLIPEEIIELVKEVHPEIELLYKAIKTHKLSGHGSGLENSWKEEALKKFDDNPNSFKFVKRPFLEDSGLYFFAYGQERRDFTGGILKTIAEERKLSITGAQKLFKIYKEQTD